MLPHVRRACLVLSALAVAACAAPAAPDNSRGSGASFTEDDFACLREAIYHEAAARSVDGGRAVAHVILNRAEDPRFPDSVCDVVRDGEQAGRCQFSYRCDGRPEVLADEIKLATASKAAEMALQNPEADVSKGALFFHANWMPPGWFASLKRTVSLGGNIFYTEG